MKSQTATPPWHIIMPFYIVSIEGNIGAGKSTLLKRLVACQFSNVKVIMLDEPVDEWATIQDEQGNTMLSKFYNNQPRYAFAFQMMAFVSRLAILKRAIAQAESNPEVTHLLVTERSVLTDRHVFAQMLRDKNCMESVEHQIYVKWFDEFVETNKSIHLAFYLKSEPDVCLTRVKQRNRPGEESITLELLTECHQYHQSFIDMLSTMNVHIFTLCANNDVETIANEMYGHLCLHLTQH